MAKKREIRNSTAEFLIFQAENKEQGIEVMYADETIWCTQKAMAALFDVGVPAISKHLANVFETGELNEEATISKMETVQQEGSRAVKRSVVMYKLDAIIAVGYRVNNIRATQLWGKRRLSDLTIAETAEIGQDRPSDCCQTVVRGFSKALDLMAGV